MRYLSSSAVSSSSNLHARRAAVCSLHWAMLLWTSLSSTSLAFSCLRRDAATPPPSAPPSNMWAQFRLLSSSMCSCGNMWGHSTAVSDELSASTSTEMRWVRTVTPEWDAPLENPGLGLSPSSAVSSGCSALAPERISTCVCICKLRLCAVCTVWTIPCLCSAAPWFVSVNEAPGVDG